MWVAHQQLFISAKADADPASQRHRHLPEVLGSCEVGHPQLLRSKLLLCDVQGLAAATAGHSVQEGDVGALWIELESMAINLSVSIFRTDRSCGL